MPNVNDAAVGTKFTFTPAELEALINQSPNAIPPGAQAGSLLIRRSVRVYKGVYDFAVQGGAISSINLYDAIYAPGVSSMPGLGLGVAQKNVFKPLILPDKAIVIRAVIHVVTAVTSGGAATLAFTSGVANNDLLTATGKATFSAGAIVDGLPLQGAAAGANTSYVTVAAASKSVGVIPQVVIAAAALTAGKINVHLECLLSD